MYYVTGLDIARKFELSSGIKHSKECNNYLELDLLRSSEKIQLNFKLT